ncbi:hypothetical protein Hypma_010736, partial [Hypsizygus marmoreus]
MRGDVFGLEKLPIKPILRCLRSSSLSRMGWQFSTTWILDYLSVRMGALPLPPFTLLPRAANPVLRRCLILRVLSPDIIDFYNSSIHNYLHSLAICEEASCLPSTSTALHVVAILLYDHLMTFGQKETKYTIFATSKTRSAYWFLFKPLSCIFGNTVEVILFFTTISSSTFILLSDRFAFLSPTPSTSLSFRYCSCKQYSLFRQLMLISTGSFLLTLRIYALYGCSRRILAFMVGSWAIMTGISCVCFYFLLRLTLALKGNGTVGIVRTENCSCRAGNRLSCWFLVGYHLTCISSRAIRGSFVDTSFVLDQTVVAGLAGHGKRSLYSTPLFLF